MKKEMSCWTALALLVGAIILLPLVSLLNGWVLSILWGWFVVPTLHLPPLTLFPAIGIALVAAFLIYVPSIEHPNDTMRKTIARVIGLTFGRSFSYLAFGWVIHEIMVRF